MLKKFCRLMIFCLTVLLSSPTSAQLRAEDLQLTCAFASMAAYSSETGTLVRNELTARGWTVEPIEAYASKADAKALLLRQDAPDGRLNILALCGTEDQKDAEIDLRVKPVPFDVEGGSVHQGFNDYTDVLLNSERFQALIGELKSTNERLYLTGHSLGGAVAILTAARLTELGLGDRIEVLTFGAPAVGDRYFAEHFDGKFNLMRITVSGDPIKKSLRALGYAHFGIPIKYIPEKSVEHFRHKMAVYLDCALRNYYDVAVNDDMLDDGSKIYATPLRIIRGSFDANDEKYVVAIIRDVLSSRGSGVVFDREASVTIDGDKHEEDFAEVDEEYLTRARTAGCDRVLIQSIEVKRVREARADIDRIVIERVVYNLNGFPLSMQTSSMNTKELTALEAILFAQLQASL